MLRELRIRDVAIVEDVTVEFGPGLNVLSGETGTGKSIILGALGLVLGARASGDIVRTGAEQAEVEARVDRDEDVDAILAELDMVPDDEEDGLLLRRVVTSAGRSRAWVGGTGAPVAALRKLAAVLVDYSAQHEHQVLLDEGTHLAILDRSVGLDGARRRVGEGFAELRAALLERERLSAAERERRERQEWIAFQLDELDRADPQPGETGEMESRRRLLRSVEERAAAAREADGALYSGAGSAVERLGLAVRRLRTLVGLDPAAHELLEGVEASLVRAEDAGRDLLDYARRARSDPEDLARMEERLSLLRGLARKHRCDPDGLPAVRDALRAEVDELASVEARLDSLDARIEEVRAAALDACVDLSRQRAVAAGRLSRDVERELASLAMERATFRVSLEAVAAGGEAVGLGRAGEPPWAVSSGAERARFLLSANQGEEPRALASVASGGELSRILLAVRRALSGSSPVQTCVYDEIDAGLGGASAEVVGRKLSEVSRSVQVLCITHLPQIAAFADVHFRVEKRVVAGRTRTEAVRLQDEAAVDELVRMLAGTGTGAADAFARELIARARPAIIPTRPGAEAPAEAAR